MRDDPARDALGRTRGLHELPEQRAQQEHEEPGRHEAGEAAHVGAGEGRGALRRELREQLEAAGERDQERAQGRRDQQLDAPHRQVDQEAEPQQQADQAEHACPRCLTGTHPISGKGVRPFYVGASFAAGGGPGMLLTYKCRAPPPGVPCPAKLAALTPVVTRTGNTWGTR